ncbi:MAG: glycosyltransferase family 4 protein [Crocinitomicaceae bacterium]|nr:glycosyltransferase family 4 protein [Crocinitomicaceae bacterium]
MEQQADVIGKIHRVSFVRLLPDDERKPTNDSSFSFDYINVFYHRSKNPIKNHFAKKQALKLAFSTIKGISIIHGHVSYPGGWMFVLAKKMFNCPLVLTEHGSYFSATVKWKFPMSYIVQKTINSADKVIAVSSFLARFITQRFPQLEVSVVGNPIVVDVFNKPSIPSESIRFLHISTLDEIKNAMPIIDAFERVLQRYPSAYLTIVSDEDYTRYKELVVERKMEENVSFFGPVKHEEIPTFYQQADCFVLNSNFETFSIVIAEAWSSGIPVISTPVGIAYEKNEQSLIQVDGSSESLVNAISYFIDNKEKYQSNEIKECALPFSSTAFIEKITIVYESLLNTK